MGNPLPTPASARVTHFHSPSAWIEGAAREQCRQTAALPGVTRIATLPDLHPGKFGPVGCAIAATSLRPRLVGADVGCGMGLFALDLPARRLRPDKAADRLRRLALTWDGDGRTLLDEAGLDVAFADGLGTIGLGNHFAEVQAVGEVVDAEAARALGLDHDLCVILVHCGSRGHGAELLDAVQAPGDVAFQAGSAEASAYLDRHDALVGWAALNRRVVARRVGDALGADVRFLTDVPHNLVVRDGDGFLHFKGAAVASAGTCRIVPVAGSRGTPTMLVKASDDLACSDGAVSHGCGRRYDRASMRHRAGRTRSEREALARNAYGGRIVCDDRALLAEEAPEAYKPIGRVVADLEAFGLAHPVAELHPKVTFKVVAEAGR